MKKTNLQHQVLLHRGAHDFEEACGIANDSAAVEDRQHRLQCEHLQKVTIY